MLLGKLLKGVQNSSNNLLYAENSVDNVGKQGILSNVPTTIQPMPIMKATENMGGLASLGGKNIRDLMDMQRNTFSRFLPEPRGGFMSLGGIQTLPPIPVNIEESETYGQIPLMGIPTLGINPLGIDLQDLSKMDFSQLGRG